MTRRRCAILFGTLDVTVSVAILIGVFGGLPARYAPVDWSCALLAALELAAGMGLLLRSKGHAFIARLASAVALTFGLVSFTLLAVTATWLGSVYGQVGRGGEIVLGIAAALIFPYLILLPASELVWLQPESSANP
jgi:hypothetical protein